MDFMLHYIVIPSLNETCAVEFLGEIVAYILHKTREIMVTEFNSCIIYYCCKFWMYIDSNQN